MLEIKRCSKIIFITQQTYNPKKYRCFDEKIIINIINLTGSTQE